MKPNGYVELPAEYVYQQAVDILKFIKECRDEAKEEAIANVTKRSFFGIKLKDRSREECIKYLQNDSFFSTWYTIESMYWRYEDQMEEMKRVAKLGAPVMVATEIAANFKAKEKV